MVDGSPALGHYLFGVSITQRASYLPADAGQDDYDRETHPFALLHVRFPIIPIKSVIVFVKDCKFLETFFFY